MKYLDGQDIRVGDKLQVWEGCQGIVVAVIEDNAYSKNYPENEWSYLKTGVLIDTDVAGLIHFITPDRRFSLIERRG